MGEGPIADLRQTWHPRQADEPAAWLANVLDWVGKGHPINQIAAMELVSQSGKAGRHLGMSDLYWLTDEQMARLRPYFLKSHGKPRVDDRRVLSGIVFVNRNGLRWRDAPKDYGPHKAYTIAGSAGAKWVCSSA